jgi:hypothetical protein
MVKIVPSRHFKEMLKERAIDEKRVKNVLDAPDKIEPHEDGTMHYIKKISENGNRYLRVIINEMVIPAKGVTAFFDRRIGKKK